MGKYLHSLHVPCMCASALLCDCRQLMGKYLHSLKPKMLDQAQDDNNQDVPALISPNMPHRQVRTMPTCTHARIMSSRPNVQHRQVCYQSYPANATSVSKAHSQAQAGSAED